MTLVKIHVQHVGEKAMFDKEDSSPDQHHASPEINPQLMNMNPR